MEGIKASGVDLPGFIRTGVVSGLRQLLEFGLFHGDPHPGNIFALRDGRIAYVDFGNVAELSQRNKEVGAGRRVGGVGWGGVGCRQLVGWAGLPVEPLGRPMRGQRCCLHAAQPVMREGASYPCPGPCPETNFPWPSPLATPACRC